MSQRQKSCELELNINYYEFVTDVLLFEITFNLSSFFASPLKKMWFNELDNGFILGNVTQVTRKWQKWPNFFLPYISKLSILLNASTKFHRLKSYRYAIIFSYTFKKSCGLAIFTFFVIIQTELHNFYDTVCISKNRMKIQQKITNSWCLHAVTMTMWFLFLAYYSVPTYRHTLYGK